jgi:hypothetical protein
LSARQWQDVREETGLGDPRCEGCGNPVGAAEVVSRPCRLGYCVIVSCKCGYEFCSFGPIGCPACAPWRSPRLRKIRQDYARRRR